MRRLSVAPGRSRPSRAGIPAADSTFLRTAPSLFAVSSRSAKREPILDGARARRRPAAQVAKRRAAGSPRRRPRPPRADREQDRRGATREAARAAARARLRAPCTEARRSPRAGEHRSASPKSFGSQTSRVPSMSATSPASWPRIVVERAREPVERSGALVVGLERSHQRAVPLRDRAAARRRRASPTGPIRAASGRRCASQ